MNRLLLLLLCILLTGTPALCATHSTEVQLADSPSKTAFNPEQIILTEPKSDCIEGIVLYTQHYGSDEAKRLVKEKVDIGEDSTANYIDLRNGNVLFIPDTNTIIETSLAKINLGAQTNLFVIKSKDTLIIYDLFQAQKHQTTIIVGKKKIVLAPGLMLAISKENVEDFEHLQTNCRTIDYSNEKKINVCDSKLKVFLADFSIASAMNSIRPLMLLTRPTNTENKVVMEKSTSTALSANDNIDTLKLVGDFDNPERNSVKEQFAFNSL